MALTARDVMTREVISVTPSTLLSELARICAEDRISGCPVVTLDGRLVGIVSRTDLVERLLDGRLDRTGDDALRRMLQLEAGEGYETSRSIGEHEEEAIGEVDDIMSTEVVTVAPDAPLAVVARRMADERIHRVLVMEGDSIAGIVTSLDLLAHFPG
jgi:CBS domain-containing protein